jgi:hypothetical protein
MKSECEANFNSKIIEKVKKTWLFNFYFKKLYIFK